MQRILIIRLGALGDFVLSFPAFAAIRAHHPAARITLLTTAPFAGLAKDSPWFDAVEIDSRPGWTEFRGLRHLRRQLLGHDFVYDLQTSGRSSRYFWLAGCPPWSGIARFCSHPDPNPRRDDLHTVARQRGQLAAAGVCPAPIDLTWLKGQGPRLQTPYALVIPGTSASQGGAKKWPAACFALCAAGLAQRGVRPVVAGSLAEAADAATILAVCPEALDLTGRTTLQDLAGLAARAHLALGGDTGPIHLAAMMDCPVIALFSRFSNPALAAPVGNTRLIQAHRLDDVSVDAVLAAVDKILAERSRVTAPGL